MVDGNQLRNRSTLTVVIPALNEEKAIGTTIERCLAARDEILQKSGLEDIEWIVVSDGSTDRTVEIIRGFPQVEAIVFEKNRGYGAAIKAGWQQGRGEWLGFLDADGTCDPRTFGELARVAQEEGAEVVLGSRMGPDSKMPKLRRLGNRIYAFLLGLLCGQQVTDTASGMRVVSRHALQWLYPLPDGLHFTPAMSARALLNGLRVVEVPMHYEERIGRSKLRVLQDGVRFLWTILSGALCYQPERLFFAMMVVCVGLLCLLAAYPTEFYLDHRQLEDWMIYRFAVCFVLGCFAHLLLLGTALTSRIAEFGPRRKSAKAFWPSLPGSLLRGPVLVAMIFGFLLVSFLFLRPGIIEYAQTRHVTLHWSRLLAGSFALLCGLQTAVFAVLFQVLAVWLGYRKQQELAEPLPSRDRK